MKYTLPKTVDIDGVSLRIRYDYRVILEIIEALNDRDLTQSDKAEAVIEMFYVDPEQVKNIEKALKECFLFIDQGESKSKKGAKLVEWEQDFDYIVAPVNRVIGREIRDIDYDPINNTGGLHWWTFLSAYMEIGPDCLFSQIVSMRDKIARGKKLEKYEKEWIARNNDIITIRNKYSEAEEEFIKQWTQGGDSNGS